MDRRRFLKYAGATAAVVGASALGLNYLTEQSPSIGKQTSSTTLTPRLSTTTVSSAPSSESVQLASLHGRLFFDYNGNGVQDGEEPPIAGALVQLKDYVYGKVVAETLTDSSGDYKLEDVRTGSCRLHLGVDLFSDKRLRYMCRSSDEFTAIPEGYDVALDENAVMNIGLMEGFLTLPFVSEVYAELSSYFDHDLAQGKVRNYLGNTTHTSDNHQGIDWGLPAGTSLVASAPGKVGEIAENERGARYIDLIHSNNMVTSYGHISEALRTSNEWVERGDVVALSGESGSPGQPHIHFGLFREGEPGHYDIAVDPFNDVFGDSPGYWTKDNDPRYSAQ